MTKYFFETEEEDGFEDQNVVYKEEQDVILEMMIHYQFPRSDDTIWKDISGDVSVSKSINNAYVNK